MRGQNHRRDFLKSSALAGAGFWVAGSTHAGRARAEESASPNEQINFACIGIDGKGRSDSADAARRGKVVAICDIDEKKLEAASKVHKDAKKFTDFRKLFDEMGKDIDAVTVSTPDHTHAAATSMAIKMGKHCYTQKPLTHTIYEARRLGELAREHKVVTQMGNQGTAESGVRRAAATIQAGALGDVKEVHVWTNRAIWPQGTKRPAESECPSFVKWEDWIGPAEFRSYAEGYHPFKWRGWWAFGTGALGDMACHTMNMAYMGLGLRDPISVQATTSGHNKDSYPEWSVIRYEFAATDKRPAVTLYWYDGGSKLPPERRPSRDLFGTLLGDKPVKESGSLIIGDKGKLYSPDDYGAQYVMDVEQPKVEFTAAPQGGHFSEFTNAIRGEGKTVSNFPDYSGPLTETVLLGNLAVWVADQGEGPKVEWDAKNLKSTNMPELASIVKSTYREGYTL